MELKVPKVKQPFGSVLCGPACVKMLLAYHFGTRMKLREIAKALPMIETGVPIADLGTFLLANGCHVILKFWLRGLPPQWFGEDNYETLKRILSLPIQNQSIKAEWNFHRQSLLSFLEADGLLVLSPIWSNEIRQELQAERPIILNINNRLPKSLGEKNRGHYFVISGISEFQNPDELQLLTFINPGDGQKNVRPMEEVLYSCHILYGAALFVCPKGQKKRTAPDVQVRSPLIQAWSRGFRLITFRP